MKISRLVIIVFGILSFSSCATLINRRSVDVNIFTDVDPAIVCIKDSDECYVTPATINMSRSKSNVDLIVKKDTITKSVTLKSQVSTAFMLDFLTLNFLGMAVDFTNPKMYSYPKSNYISVTGKYINKRYSGVLPTKRSQSTKNQLYFKISIPEGNLFYINKGNSYGDASGFLGISAGVEYFFKDLYSINLDCGVMIDYMVPIPATVDYFGSHDSYAASYLDLQVGKDVKFFHFDLGIQGNRTRYYSYKEEETDFLWGEDVEKKSYRFPHGYDVKEVFYRQYNAGLALSGYYKLSDGFCLGLNYYPSCFSWHNGDFDFHYSHLMMFEFIFRPKLFDPKGTSVKERISMALNSFGK